MSYGRGLILMVIAIMLATTVIVSDPSEGSTVYEMECNNVTFVYFTDGVEINTSKEYPVSIHLSNGNTTPVTVKIVDDGNGVINLSLTNEQIMLDGGETVDISGSFVTDRYTPMGNYGITIVMSVMDGVSTDVPQSIVTIPASVISNYSSGELFNRILGIFDNNLPAPMNTAIGAAIITFIAWIGVSILVSAIVLFILRSAFMITEKDSNTLGRNTSIGVFFCTMLVGVRLCLLIGGMNERVVDETTKFSDTLYIIFIALIVWDIYKTLVTRALQKMEKRDIGGMDTSLIPLFKAIGRIVIVVMCIAIILSTYGVNFVTLITSAGLAGLGLSFGIKPAINELFSGLVVLMTRPFKVGDYVTVGTDDRLKVAEIGILRTKFETGFTPEEASMPNSKIASSKLVNISHKTRMYRNTVSVKVPFDSNLTLIKKLVKKVASEHPNIVTDGSVPKPSAVFSSCNDGSAIIVTLAFYVRDYDVNMSTCCQIREGILRAFEERNITIPLNKMEVTVFKGGQENAQ